MVYTPGMDLVGIGLLAAAFGTMAWSLHSLRADLVEEWKQLRIARAQIMRFEAESAATQSKDPSKWAPVISSVVSLLRGQGVPEEAIVKLAEDHLGAVVEIPSAGDRPA